MIQLFYDRTKPCTTHMYMPLIYIYIYLMYMLWVAGLDFYVLPLRWWGQQTIDRLDIMKQMLKRTKTREYNNNNNNNKTIIIIIINLCSVVIQVSQNKGMINQTIQEMAFKRNINIYIKKKKKIWIVVVTHYS